MRNFTLSFLLHPAVHSPYARWSSNIRSPTLHSMGYRGKTEEQEEARRLRADSWTLADIAEKLGVSKSSVSLWVRDVPFTPSPRRYGAQRRPHPQHLAKLAQIKELNDRGRERI